MQLPDVDVLVYAHRTDAAEHGRYAEWLLQLVNRREQFAISPLILAQFVATVTDPKVFEPPTPLNVALDFCKQLVEWPHSVGIHPTSHQWPIFTALCDSTNACGPDAVKASIVAVAIEHDCELASAEENLDRFSGLRWFHPLKNVSASPASSIADS